MLQEGYPVPSAPQWNQIDKQVIIMGSMGEMKKQYHTLDLELEQALLKNKQLLL